jgi:aerobic carbon-monoxide dehydrogenase medium subunit
MYLPDFDYYCPQTLKEVCELLSLFGKEAKLISGGTDVLPKMKQAMIAPKVLVSLKNIPEIGGIEAVQGQGVVIGAKATHNDLVNSALLKKKYPSVSGAADSMANNQVRNRGTIGGNIVNAVPSADLPPILIALRSKVTLVGTKGSRTVALEDFFTGPGQSVIAGDEVLTHILIPDQPTTGSAYVKFGLRHSGALAVVGVAASVVFKNQTIQDARIVLGAVAPIPMRAKKAEEIVNGKAPGKELLEEAGRMASMESRPISDLRGSEEYRRDMVRVFTKRALKKAVHSESHSSH